MIRSFLRHWALLDLNVFRNWANDHRVAQAKLIDNKDGTYGRAFDLRLSPSEGVIASSETMQTALRQGMQAIEPLPSGPPRRTRRAPDLQELVNRFGTFNQITPEAWAQYDRQFEQWRAELRHGFADIPWDAPS